MSNFIKTDGFEGQNTLGLQVVNLYITDTSGSVGDWVAIYAGDTTNPGAIDGESYRIADADNADAKYDTVGVLMQTVTAAGFYPVAVKGRVQANVTSGASVASGDRLTIGSTAGRAIEITGTDPDLRIIGACRSTPSGNLAYVDIYPHPRFL
jgi:hypothetical protein